MVTIVCYSHTDYTDVLQVQEQFLRMLPCKKVLIINRLPQVPIHFDSVVFYDDSLKYSKRIAQSFSQLSDEYVLFLHDMDVITHCSIPQIERLIEFMKNKSIDRVDLQYTKCIEEESLPFENVTLTRSHDFIYNVNPSIWKRDVLLDIMNKFDKDYRTIENTETQEYCKRFNIYKLWSPKKISAGYFHVTDLFVFIHLTHGGKLLPIRDNNLEPYLNVIYKGIHLSFSFRREIRRTMH